MLINWPLDANYLTNADTAIKSILHRLVVAPAAAFTAAIIMGDINNKLEQVQPSKHFPAATAVSSNWQSIHGKTF